MTEWVVKKIDDVCEINKLSIGKNYPFDEINYLDTGSITQGKIESFQKFKVSEAPSRAKRIVKPGDIVYSLVRPNQNHYGHLKTVEDNLVASTGFAVLTPKSNVSGGFLYYYITQEWITDHLHNIAEGSTSAYPSLKPEDIANYEIILPPLPEQQAIAEVLSSLDDKIDLLHRNNKTLEQMAETLFRQWFVEDESKWGTVKDEFDVIMGQSPPGNTYNENKQGIPFYQGRTDFTFRFPERRVFCTAPTRMAKAFDTLLSVRAPVGDVNIAIEECCIGRGLASLRHKNKNVHYSYTYLLFNYIKDSFDVHEQSGTVFGSISKDELLALKCPVLKKAELFNKEISLLEDKVTENSKQIFKLTDIKETLLPKLMNGQVRVSFN